MTDSYPPIKVSNAISKMQSQAYWLIDAEDCDKYYAVMSIIEIICDDDKNAISKFIENLNREV